ncbi:MAG: DUF6788 family protein [Candidatus Aerophobetes bacterium]|nr:DUF6788 family protein [Candidatus Aerophobetes bacterium]
MGNELNISDIRQKIVWLREDRKRLEDSLFRPGKTMRASLVFILNYCGKKDCRCRRGFPHGPYPYLSERRKGKTRMTYVKKRDLPEVRKLTEEYVRFQKSLARLTKINEKIRSLLEIIRDRNSQDVDEYRKKIIENKKKS